MCVCVFVYVCVLDSGKLCDGDKYRNARVYILCTNNNMSVYNRYTYIYTHI